MLEIRAECMFLLRRAALKGSKVSTAVVWDSKYPVQIPGRKYNLSTGIPVFVLYRRPVLTVRVGAIGLRHY